MEEKILQVVEQLAQKVDQRFDAIDQKFDAIDQRFDTIENRINDLQQDVKENRSIINTIQHDVKDTQTIMKHCLGDLYEQHDKTHIKILEIDEKISDFQLDLNALTVKTARNNSIILKLDKKNI